MMLHNPAPALWRLLSAALVLLLLIFYGGSLMHADIVLDLSLRLQAPSFAHWFGTDNLGRDLWQRCFQGTMTSLQIGITASLFSGAIALLLSGIALLHPRLDALVRLLIDALLALPHLLLLILICFTLGGGKSGVILAVALTHWPRLTLILRAETLRIGASDYVILSRQLGNSAWRRWRTHYFPALFPQWLTGTLLMFPHAVLHSAALSFLGFGLAPHDASLGILLSDALRYLTTGGWWLAFFPGLLLLVLVLLVDQCARTLQRLWIKEG